MLFPLARVTRSQAYVFAVGLAGLWIKSCQLLAFITPGRILIQLNQFSLDEFQRQNLVYLKGIVSLPTAMSFEDLFHRIRTKVGSAARVRVEKYLP